MLERLWRKRNPHTLLVGMQTGAATVKNSMEISQKIKNRSTRAQPGGIVVEFVHSAWWPRVQGFGSWEQTYTLLIKPCCDGIPHTKWRKIGTDVSSGPNFFTKKKKETKKKYVNIQINKMEKGLEHLHKSYTVFITW